MEKSEQPKRTACADRCEARYLRCVSNTYTGCVEVLRVCREECGDPAK